MVKKLSCVSCGSLKRFPHTFTSSSLQSYWVHIYSCYCQFFPRTNFKSLFARFNSNFMRFGQLEKLRDLILSYSLRARMLYDVDGISNDNTWHRGINHKTTKTCVRLFTFFVACSQSTLLCQSEKS